MLDRFFDNYVNAPVPWIVDAMMKPDGNQGPWRGVLDKSYAWLDTWLKDREHAAAGQFSLADCAAAPALLYADWVHPIDENLSYLRTYRSALLARPSVARAVDDARPFRHYLPFSAPEGPD